ncbi:Lipoprotein-releasing system ATP-binding protein LolD [Geodia barretti]|uniref:Lipoprotein-releasing system ATP-binding protein LolD n=1 Tax=Geodia barretti TaxID=519541 RepID=A0AA35RPV3_GEOBA|nr:Lipoprotein-releasing system ATP-binding protein LolD [Geodia barretti]
MSDSIVSASTLSRRFEGGGSEVWAVSNVNLEIGSGELVAFTGRSGSGKTTLLNLLSGLDRPTSGAALFRGQDLSRLPERELVEFRRRSIGFVFQSFGLMPLLSAQENVELPLHIIGVSWRERRRRAQEALASVGLGPRARHRPYELSGGEQQRVSIARALVTGPEVVFADEPTGELDTTTARSIIDILRRISAEGTTVIVATHDLSLAAAADRQLEMSDGLLKEP